MRRLLTVAIAVTAWMPFHPDPLARPVEPVTAPAPQRWTMVPDELGWPTSEPPPPEPEPEPPPTTRVRRVRVAPEEIVEIIRAAADEFGVDAELLVAIIGCESGFDPSARNPRSGALGLGQHLPGLFGARAEAIGADPDAWDDPTTNARVTAWLLARSGTAPWASSSRCWA